MRRRVRERGHSADTRCIALNGRLKEALAARAPRPHNRGRQPYAPDFVDTFLQQLINGLTLGSVYAIVALGYTMVYGIIQLINFAHGEVVMIGAMVAYSVFVGMVGATVAMSPLAIVLIGLVTAFPACMVVGYTLERVA